MKQIIQRNLPLDTRYTLIDKSYIPVIDGGGTVCADCGRFISHIAHVRSEKGKHYNVGFDCLEKLLKNNHLLCNFNLETLKEYKKQLNKIIRFSREIKELINNNPQMTGLFFEPQAFESDYYTYYILFNEQTKSRHNMSVKIKGIDYKLLHKTIANIFSEKLTIYYN